MILRRIASLLYYYISIIIIIIIFTIMIYSNRIPLLASGSSSTVTITNTAAHKRILLLLSQQQLHTFFDTTRITTRTRYRQQNESLQQQQQQQQQLAHERHNTILLQSLSLSSLLLLLQRQCTDRIWQQRRMYPIQKSHYIPTFGSHRYYSVISSSSSISVSMFNNNNNNNNILVPVVRDLYATTTATTRSSSTTAFITTTTTLTKQQFSTQSNTAATTTTKKNSKNKKTIRSSNNNNNNKWRMGILRHNNNNNDHHPEVGGEGQGVKRRPKIYKSIHWERRSKKRDEDDNDNNDDFVLSSSMGSTISGKMKLYRADRVLANRTGKSRKECFQLLKDRRVFIVVDEIYNHNNSSSSNNNNNDITTTTTNSKKQLLQSGNSKNTKNNNNNNNDDDPILVSAIEESINNNNNNNNNASTNMIQQYRLQVIVGPSTKISMHTQLRIDKYQIVPLPPPLLMIYHKPKWVLSVRRDPLGRPCISDTLLGAISGSSTGTNTNTNINIDSSLQQQHTTTSTINTKPAPPPLHPVGRLDHDTTGLLLFSSSGPLTQALLHPKHNIEKEYVAVVTGIVNVDELRTILAAGVTTGEGIHTAQLIAAEPNVPIPEDVPTYLANIKAGLPSEYNTTDLKIRGYLDIFDATNLSTITVTVSEGKYRMVRRILANVGHPVVTLHRKRLGAISLGNVPVGHTRPLTPKEMRWAQEQLQLGSKVIMKQKNTNNSTTDNAEDFDDEFN